MTILAIDPGQSGAVALLDRVNEKWQLEIRRDFKTLEEISRGIRHLVTRANAEWAGIDVAVIERVHAMPGQGVVSMFSFGRSTGVAFGSLYSLLPEGVPVEDVTPQKWQGFFREKYAISREEQFDSRIVAQKLFPDHPQFFTRKKDHNSADAALIGAWKFLTSN